MSNRQAVTNITALAILIITSVVDLCMQLATGIISSSMMAHFLLIVIMLFLLTLCGVVAISLASIKDYLQVIHEKQNRRALEEFESDETKALTETLKDYSTKLSIMAQSSCPLSVLTRTVSTPINCCCGSLFSRSKDDEGNDLNSLKPYFPHHVGEEESVDQLLSHCF